MESLFEQLALGSLMIALTIVLQVLFVASSIFVLSHHGSWISKPPMLPRVSLALTALVLWLVLGISVSTWIWSFLFLYLGTLNSLPEALYFATVTFTTLGYGDVLPNEGSRLLSSLCAVNGLIIFGLNTAFLIEFISRLRLDKHSRDGQKK